MQQRNSNQLNAFQIIHWNSNDSIKEVTITEPVLMTVNQTPTMSALRKVVDLPLTYIIYHVIIQGNIQTNVRLMNRTLAYSKYKLYPAD